MSKIPKDWENIADILTPEGYERIEVGEVLTFKRNWIEVHYKVMKKTAKRVYIKPIKLYNPDEIGIKDKKTGKQLV